MTSHKNVSAPQAVSNSGAPESSPEGAPSATATKWLQVALWIWFGFAVALCIKVLVEGDRHSVYPAFSGGSQDWWAGEVMYDHQGYYYSPTFSVMFTPFALLPNRLGQMLWGIASVAFFVWALRVFYRDVLSPRLPRDMEAGFLLLTLGGALRGIWSLQSNAALMACVLLASAAIVRQRWWKSAWLLAAPIYIKVWPAVVAGLLTLQWPRKLLGRGIVCCVALAAVPFLTKPPAAVVGYYHDWIDCLQARQATAERFTGYRDAWTIWEQFDATVDPHAYFVLQIMGGLMLLAYCGWLRISKQSAQRSNESLVVHTLAAWCVWQLLLGPGSERLTFVIIAPLAAWSVVTSYTERRAFPLAVASFVTMFVLGAGGIERTLLPWIPFAPAIQPMGIVLFAIWLARHTFAQATIEPPAAKRRCDPILAEYSAEHEGAASFRVTQSRSRQAEVV